VLGGVVVKGEQLVKVASDLRDSLGELGPVGGRERLRRGQGVRLVLGAPDLGERLLRPRVRGSGQRREDMSQVLSWLQVIGQPLQGAD